MSIPACESLSPDVLVILDTASDSPDVILNEIAALRQISLTLPILGYIDLAGPMVHCVTRAVNLGMTSIWLQGTDDVWGRVQTLFDDALRQSVLHVLEQPINNAGHPLVKRFVRYCFHSAMTPVRVEQAVLDLNIDGRALRRALHACELPSAEWFLTKSRMLFAARLLENPQREVRDIAVLLGVSDVKILRRQLAEHVGPNFVRERTPGAFIQQLDVVQNILNRQIGYRKIP